MKEKRLFTETEAADYLSISRHTLRQQRSDGGRKNRIPFVPYVKHGRSIKYRKDVLDAYIDKLLLVIDDTFQLGDA